MTFFDRLSKNAERVLNPLSIIICIATLSKKQKPLFFSGFCFLLL